MTRYGSLIPATIKIFYKWELVLQLKITNLMKELLILSMYSYDYGNKTESDKLSYFHVFLYLIPKVFFGSVGQVMYVVETFVPTISRTKL